MKRINILSAAIFLLVIVYFVSLWKTPPKFLAKYKEAVVVFFDKQSMHPTKFPLWLSSNEQMLLIRSISDAKNYLEFGSGGSTFIGLKYSNANVVSVESDENWLNVMRQWRYIRRNENKRLRFYLSDIGIVGYLGYPLDNKNKNLYSDYSKKVFVDNPRKYDVVLIDGRFRVACALETILNTDDDVKILWHDFPNRPYYHVILEFLEVKDSADKLVLLTKKKNIDKKRVERLYSKYKNRPE